MTKWYWKEVFNIALRVFGYMLIFGFIGFMLVPGLMGLTAWVRVPLMTVMLVAVAMLFFMEGSFRGERDCVMTETLEKPTRTGGRYEATPAEEAKRFRRMKAPLGAALGILPLFVLAVVVAITVKPYAYTVQDLPSWLSPYLQRPEVGDALVYMRGEPVSASIADYCRVAVRFLLFPFMGLFGTLTDEASLLFDRISPLLALIMPSMVAIGYQFGPRRRARNLKAVEKAKNTPRKRLKKDRKRQTGPKEKKQLV